MKFSFGVFVCWQYWLGVFALLYVSAVSLVFSDFPSSGTLF